MKSFTLLQVLAEYGGPRALAADTEAAARMRMWSSRCLTDTSIHVADTSFGGMNVSGMPAANRTWKESERSIYIGKAQTKMGRGL